MNDIKQFELDKLRYARAMSKDKSLRQLGVRLVEKSAPYRYSYMFSWLGLPIIQMPPDIVALQELIWKIKPDLIIETGIARGGSLIFYASMLELLGRGKVVGIDIDIRAHNRKAVERHPLAKRIKMLEGSSTDQKILTKVGQIVKKHRQVLVCLDSLHTHDHVLAELDLYSPFVTKGSYLVAFDTVVESMPARFFKDRPWGKSDNPATAVRSFLRGNNNFVVDKDIEHKLLITSAPGGFLRKVK